MRRIVWNQTEYRLFWSGGIDSTVLLLSMLFQGISVEPFWVAVNAAPDAMNHEHEARERIVRSLAADQRKLLRPERRFAVPDYYDAFVDIRLQLAVAGIHTTTRIPRSAAQGYIRWNHVALLAVARIVGSAVSGICQQQQISRMPAEQKMAVDRGLLMPIVDWTKSQILDEADSLGILEMLRDTWSCPNPIENKPCHRPGCVWCRDRALLDARLVN